MQLGRLEAMNHRQNVSTNLQPLLWRNRSAASDQATYDPSSFQFEGLLQLHATENGDFVATHFWMSENYFGTWNVVDFSRFG